MLHLLISPSKTALGFKIRDCDDNSLYESLDDAILRTPILKDFQPAGKLSQTKPVVYE